MARFTTAIAFQLLGTSGIRLLSRAYQSRTFSRMKRNIGSCTDVGQSRENSSRSHIVFRQRKINQMSNNIRGIQLKKRKQSPYTLSRRYKGIQLLDDVDLFSAKLSNRDRPIIGDNQFLGQIQSLRKGNRLCDLHKLLISFKTDSPKMLNIVS